MNTGTFHDWKILKHKIPQLIKQGKCEASVKAVANELGMSRTTLSDGMSREFGWNSDKLKSFQREELVSWKPKKVSYPPVFMKAAVFDIEVTNFKADSVSDILVCCSILPLDGEVYTINISHDEVRSKDNDTRVLTDTLEALSRYDFLIGHYIRGMDFNWLRTRSLQKKIPMPKRWMEYDTYHASKRMGLATGKGLSNLCAFFGIDGVKTKIDRPKWTNVLSQDEEVFNACVYGTPDHQYRDGVIYHCEQDVIANRKLFDVIWPEDKQMTNVPVSRRW